MNPPNDLAQEFHGYAFTECLYWLNIGKYWLWRC